MSRHRILRPSLGLLLLGGVLASTTGCVALPSPLPPGTDIPSEYAPRPAADTTAVVAELDSFLEAQGFDDDDSSMTPTTPEQLEFLADQKLYYRDQGWEWTEFDSVLALALATDACQTSILAGHRFSADDLRHHVATSPLYAGVVPANATGQDRTDMEMGTVETAAYGATYLCPADGNRWMAAYREVYGG